MNQEVINKLGIDYRLFVNGFVPVAFEFAAEITYPESESSSAGIMNSVSQTTGIIFVLFFSYILQAYGDFSCNMSMAILLAFGAIMVLFIKNNLKRLALDRTFINNKHDFEIAKGKDVC